MKSHLEFEAKNMERAIEKACIELGVSKKELKYDVISYGSSGIFGIVGAKNAKICVKKKITADSNSIVDEIFNDQKSGDRTDEAETIDNDKLSEQIVETLEEIDIDYDLLLKTGTETLEKIVFLITDEAKINSSIKDNSLFFDITCSAPSSLIGRKGRTLEAIDYLIEKILNKKQKNRIHSQIDVEGYLEKRKEKLISSALHLAEKAKRLKKPMSMGEISFNDRRYLHILLKKDNGVKTRSVGNGHYKKLIIFPQNGIEEKKDAENE
ncbi:MAG: Jag N-terminal domain-containing protein [Deltaproteobacteria bacterium]|nr:Jag N-terminal domain-containing protein [Deltaproteobacteria bacterium]